jgi:hypothetical protein
LVSSDYLNVKEKVIPAAIFQSELTAKPYSALSPQEKEQALNLLRTSKHAGDGPTAKDADEVAKKAASPYYLTSSVFTDVVIPTDSNTSCQ